ncbi:MAG: hypothetical protein RMJ98_18220, partial [Myxococcales bacterium]|nr:hypothetical protein [Polyangiaceae bacterium]MDW8251235.1 hypothetical protein [Myxococcales bacterium]
MFSIPSFLPERWLHRGVAAGVVYLATRAVGCRFDRSDRWLDITEVGGCEEGKIRCAKGLQRCENRRWRQIDDCAAKGLLCDENVGACTQCVPNSVTCRNGDVVACHPGGQSYDVYQVCDRQAGL